MYSNNFDLLNLKFYFSKLYLHLFVNSINLYLIIAYYWYCLTHFVFHYFILIINQVNLKVD